MIEQPLYSVLKGMGRNNIRKQVFLSSLEEHRSPHSLPLSNSLERVQGRTFGVVCNDEARLGTSDTLEHRDLSTWE